MNSTTGVITGTLSFTSAGTYSVTATVSDGRLSDGKTFTWTVHLTAISATPTTVAPGGTLTVSWQDIATPTATDWVGLVPMGAADTAYAAWWYTTGTTSGSRVVTLPATLPAGTYELRLFAQNNLQRLAVSSALTVSGPTLSASPTTVSAGGTVTATWSGIGTPSATDWIALVPTGAADTAYAAWWYTTGAGNGSMGLTLAPSVTVGTYELRLFARNSWQRLAVSNTLITVPAVTTVTASPATVAPSGTLTVTWQGLATPSPSDWLALVPTGAADASYVAWVYATGRTNDSTLFTLPATLPAGSYDVRLFANDTFTRLAVSPPVTVTGPGPSLAVSPVAIAPGGTLTVAWRNIAAPTALDWVGLYAEGAADASYVTRFYTSGRATDRTLATLPGSVPAGTYELRLFTNDTLTRLATSNAFAVAAGPSVTASPVAVAAGDTLTVTWAGLVAPTATDWVALVPLNGPDASFVAWSYTTGAADGTVGLALPTAVPWGTYELRLFRQDSWQRLAVSNTVAVDPTLVMSPTTVAPGGTVTVTWAGIPTPTPADWLALVPLNAPNANYVAWVYASGRAADSVLFVLPSALPAGSYDLRLFANNSWQRLAVSNVVTVTAPGPTLAVSPVTVVAGSTLTVTWQGIATPTVLDWIGVYAAGANDASYVTRVFTSGLASGSTPTVLPSVLTTGTYELRLFANNTFTRLALSNGLSVVAGP